jgi:hypothetical protein
MRYLYVRHVQHHLTVTLFMAYPHHVCCLPIWTLTRLYHFSICINSHSQTNTSACSCLRCLGPCRCTTNVTRVSRCTYRHTTIPNTANLLHVPSSVYQGLGRVVLPRASDRYRARVRFATIQSGLYTYSFIVCRITF